MKGNICGYHTAMYATCPTAQQASNKVITGVGWKLKDTRGRAILRSLGKHLIEMDRRKEIKVINLARQVAVPNSHEKPVTYAKSKTRNRHHNEALFLKPRCKYFKRVLSIDLF
ncbi:hypothetical protein KIN20_034962 [Parelaphostrongylus tenuis]|uniref:Uncharacterized protein n=1 Tax=Parelaphostrongylus tenuis TaxID=148309 RepID=A0AAD5WJK9_PARTN|nr:hypothetical protein KIN20_034962 [Parelaphostrongylus tenuis]